MYDLHEILSFKGYAPWKLLHIAEEEPDSATMIKTFILHELYREGVLSLGTHNICYAHNEDDIAHVVKAYDIVLEKFAKNRSKTALNEIMKYPEINPVFEVRKNA